MNGQKVNVATQATINAYRDLASDPAKRPALIKDSTCVSFLVYVLDDSNPDIVKPALQALWSFCENVDYRPTLRAVYGILSALEIVSQNTALDEYSLKIARDLHQILSKEASAPLRDTRNTSYSTPMRSSHQRKSQQFFLGTARSKTVTLQIKGLSCQDHRRICEQQLLKVKGVISITFDFTKKRSIIRARMDVKPETLARAIGRTKIMTAEQVVKNENGEEVLLSFDMQKLMEKENSDLPPYLPEEDSPIREKAISRHGETEKESAGWFSAAANFFTKSFYW